MVSSVVLGETVEPAVAGLLPSKDTPATGSTGSFADSKGRDAGDDDLRDLESGKIKCGAAHFRALAMGENPAIYGKFRDVDGLLNSERTLSP